MHLKPKIPRPGVRIFQNNKANRRSISLLAQVSARIQRYPDVTPPMALGRVKPQSTNLKCMRMFRIGLYNLGERTNNTHCLKVRVHTAINRADFLATICRPEVTNRKCVNGPSDYPSIQDRGAPLSEAKLAKVGDFILFQSVPVCLTLPS